MNRTIFDLANDEIYLENPPTGKEGYFEMAKRAPEPKDDSFLNTIADYSKTIAKGAIEGLGRLGKSIAPTYGYPTFEEGTLKPPPSKEQELQSQTETLDQLLHTDEGFGQHALRKGLKEAPTMLAFPGSQLSTLPRTIAAGFMGEGAKELGLPEWAQTAAELTAYIGPDITKKLLSTGKNKEIIDFAKKMGMTDEQITPLIQSDFKQRWLAKLTPKRGATQRALANTKEGIETAYGSVTNNPIAKGEISEMANGKLVNNLMKFINDMPRELRSKIEPDLKDLLNNKITGQTLMNFYKDVNSHLSGNTKALSLLKEPVRDALKSISPELGKDFEMVNALYTKYHPIAAKLKPNLASDIIQAAEVLTGVSALGAATFGYVQPLTAIVGEKVARKVAQQMLINPHLQQLSSKIVEAMNNNKPAIVMKLIKSYASQIEDTSKEFADELNSINEEDIFELLRHHS